MGNTLAIDMGITVLRCTIFDRNNDLFPSKIQKEMLLDNPKAKKYFMTDHSFYAKEHGGTFHFI